MPLPSPYDRLPTHAGSTREPVSVFTKILLVICALPCLLLGAGFLFLASGGGGRESAIFSVIGIALLILGVCMTFSRSTVAIVSSLLLAAVSVGLIWLVLAVVGAGIASR